MKRYSCHKVVEAARILAVQSGGGQGKGFVLVLDDPDEPEVHVTPKWLLSKVPEGADASHGYLVRYADGYESWSPAEAFEAGYTELPPADESEPAPV